MLFVFLRHFFIYLFVYYFFLGGPLFAFMKLYNIRVLLNRAYCWNFQIDKRNLDITVSASSKRLFFYDLLIIFVRGNADHHYWKRGIFLKKTLLSCIFGSKPHSFQLNLAWGLFHILVSFWVDRSTTAWEKGLVKCHMSASQLVNAPTY